MVNDKKEVIKQEELIVFEANIYEHIEGNVKKTVRNILNVVDALGIEEKKRLQLRKVILDSVNELGLTFKYIVKNIGK